MKIIIAYPTLNSLGGAERLCIYFIEALRKRNWDVTLATLDRTDWVHIRKVFGESLRPKNEFYLLPRMPEISILTLRQAFVALFYVLQLLLIVLKKRYDLLINMAGEIMNSTGDLIYFNAIPLTLMHVYPQIQPKYDAQWRCYSRLYCFLARVLRDPNSVFVSNSKFNQDIIEKHLGRKALVIYPPVGVQKIKSLVKNRNRENIVVTISRFRSAKGLGIIPKIAKHVENCKFIIIGTADKESKECLDEISRITRELEVQGRVQIFVNKHSTIGLEKLSTSKVFLHTQSYEAFGMSIVEAMAAGCVPVVPRNGGPWFDILNQKQGEYGYSYGSVKEAAEIIEMLMKNERLREEVSARASRRAMAFDASVFERKILDIVNKVYSRKAGEGRCIHS
jgi:glycosyltransferase involved in cell wall biosynthesis